MRVISVDVDLTEIFQCGILKYVINSYRENETIAYYKSNIFYKK